MSSFPTALSLQANSLMAAKECVESLKHVNLSTLGFVYATDHHLQHINAIYEYLQDSLPVDHWCGTVGIGICCNEHELMDEPGLAVMLTDLPADSFKVFDSINIKPDEIHELLSDWTAKGHQPYLGVVHGDPNNPQMPELVEQLPEQLGGSFLVGGLTSSRGEFPQIADGITSGGLSGLVFDESVQVVTALSQGCTPISQVHKITECQNNIIVKLDEQPALDVFKDDIGELLARDLEKIAGFIFAARPVHGIDTGDYTIRNLVGIDPQNKLLAIGDLFENGDDILFCQRDNQTALDDLHRMLDHIKKLAGQRQPRGGLYFTCLGRGEHMFGEKSRELEIIREELGEIPLIGFYANGEISRDHLYGYTGVLTLFF